METRVVKPFWESSRFWWNIGTVLIAIVQGLAGAGVIPDEALAIVNPIGNVILNQRSDGARLTVGARW